MRTGELLEGKFRVERIIGEGAMGLVVEATHLDLEERVALKFLREEAKARPDLAVRFAREARAAATIKNDHVARVYDVGTHEGAPFIVMEMLHGDDLEQILHKRGPLDALLAVEYVIQACEGLTAAHTQGIVHRDIKPGNLFVVEHGGIRDVKLLDFGISKAGLKKGTIEDVDVGGETTQIMGSPHYMSPEQIRSTKDVDARADVWSLGVVLFELLTGHTPFDGTEITAIIAQVLHHPHHPIRAYIPDIPMGLEDILDRCLQKDRNQRYQTAADLALALLAFGPKRSRAVAERAASMMALALGGDAPVDSLPPAAIPPPPGPSTSNLNLPAFVPLPVVSRSPPPAARPFPWLAIGAVLFGLGGGAFAIFSRFPSRASVTVPSVPTASFTAAIPTTTTVAIATAPAPPASVSAHPASVSPEPKPTAAVATAATTARPHAHPTPSASAGAPRPDSDIRLER